MFKSKRDSFHLFFETTKKLIGNFAIKLIDQVFLVYFFSRRLSLPEGFFLG